MLSLILKKLDKRLQAKGKEKKKAWQVWGRDITKWFLTDRYKNLIYKTKEPITITQSNWIKSFKIVSESSHLWKASLYEKLKKCNFLKENVEPEDIANTIKVVFYEFANAIERFGSSESEVKKMPIKVKDAFTIGIALKKDKRIVKKVLPFNFTTIAGVLWWHLKYFLGYGEIWRYLPLILNRKPNTIKKALHRASFKNKKLDYLKEYKNEISFYQADKYPPATMHEDIGFQEFVKEMDKFEIWYKEQEITLKTKKKEKRKRFKI
jgi:hypothetical protein